jgi:osmotically-inducible protein OsmY
MHAHTGTMANQNGRNGSTTDDNRWRQQGNDFPSVRRDEEDRYRMRDDDERFERGSGSHWEDRDRAYDRDGRGMGQSGYGAGRHAEDRSMGTQTRPAPRNTPWGGAHYEDRSGERDNFGRGRWEEGRMGMSQGYDERPTFERGYRQHQTGFGGAQGLDVRGPHRGKGPKGFEHSDDRIRERVCEALSDDHNIDATDIDVSVHQGEVTLTGTVDDRSTKRMAEDCVLQCSGVRDVHNQLRVRR